MAELGDHPFDRSMARDTAEQLGNRRKNHVLLAPEEDNPLSFPRGLRIRRRMAAVEYPGTAGNETTAPPAASASSRPMISPRLPLPRATKTSGPRRVINWRSGSDSKTTPTSNACRAASI